MEPLRDTDDDELLSPSVLAQLERLQLGTRRRLAGRFAGEHRSTRHGASMDFADFREYHPGDDYRRIDYALYARTGQLFLRLFEAEDDVALRIVLDVSASMGFSGKLRHAARLAAAIGFVALVRRDAVTLHLEPPARPPQRFAGRHDAGALFRALSSVEAAGPTDLSAAAGDVLARGGPAGVTILISDLLTPSWDTAIDRLPARGGETIVLHVLADDELDPRLSGEVDVVDSETGAVLPVSVSGDSERQYRDVVRAWLAEATAKCATRQAVYQRVLVTEPVDRFLLRAWREHGVLR